MSCHVNAIEKKSGFETRVDKDLLKDWFNREITSLDGWLMGIKVGFNKLQEKV